MPCKHTDISVDITDVHILTSSFVCWLPLSSSAVHVQIFTIMRMNFAIVIQHTLITVIIYSKLLHYFKINLPTTDFH